MIGFYSKNDLINMLFKGKDEGVDEETLKIIKKLKLKYRNLNDFEFVEIYPIKLKQIRRGTFYITE